MARHRGPNVTLKDIALRVHVSAMTVSRALSGKAHMVNPQTVQRIRDVAAELGYTPNLMARSLRGERLPTLVVLAEYISSHHYLAELVDYTTRTCERHDYGVIVCQSGQSLAQALKQFKLAGAVLLAPSQSLFFDATGTEEKRLDVDAPVVVIHSAMDQSLHNEVSPDIGDGAFQAAQHLLGLGHRRLGFLGGPPPEDEPRWFEKRRTGIERAMRERGLSSQALRYQPCPNADVAPAALQQLLRDDRPITAIMCLNDEIAVAAVHGARDLHMEVPRDLSIVGSNDIRLARYFRPTLTTLAIDVRTLVETGLNVLFEEIRQGRNAPERPIKVIQPCQLIIRESSGPPRSA
jgi:LacI family transcriptional regulator